MKVRHTQRDKRGARYAVLISAAAARLLHSFYVYRYVMLVYMLRYLRREYALLMLRYEYTKTRVLHTENVARGGKLSVSKM